MFHFIPVQLFNNKKTKIIHKNYCDRIKYIDIKSRQYDAIHK